MPAISIQFSYSSKNDLPQHITEPNPTWSRLVARIAVSFHLQPAFKTSRKPVRSKQRPSSADDEHRLDTSKLGLFYSPEIDVKYKGNNKLL